MSSLLVVAEQFQGSLRKVTFNALGFAKEAAAKLGLDLHVIVMGDNVSSAGEELGAFGATVHVVEDDALENYMTEGYTQAVAHVAKEINATMIVGAATVIGKDLLPRVAGRLGAGIASDIIEMTDEGTFKRPVWAGAAVAHIRVETDVKVVSIRPTAFAAAEPGDGGADTNEVEVEFDEDAIERVTFNDLLATESERPELTEAGIVVSGGRGMRDEEGVQLIGDMADAFGAAMGASRAACDAGMVPNELQVGQTGKVVAPDLYFAIGISGAIQHLAGMKGSKVIVAINKDAEAPIFQIADYGLVADLFKVVPELIEAGKNR